MQRSIIINNKEWIDMPKGVFFYDGLMYRIAKLKHFSNRCVYMINSKGNAVKICNGFDTILSTKRTFEDLYKKTNMNAKKVIAFIESK